MIIEKMFMDEDEEDEEEEALDADSEEVTPSTLYSHIIHVCSWSLRFTHSQSQY